MSQLLAAIVRTHLGAPWCAATLSRGAAAVLAGSIACNLDRMNTTHRFLWLVPVVAALLYPWCLQLLQTSMVAMRQTDVTVLTMAGAAVGMAGAFGVSLVAFVVIRRLMHQTGAFDRRGVRVAHVAFATPPLFTAVGVIAGLLAVRAYEYAIWSLLWLALAAGAALVPKSPPTERNRQPMGMRVTHGIAALIVLLGFLLWHLGNHAVALDGAETHHQVMSLLRIVYRPAWVEPVLLLLFALVMGTGLWLASVHTGQRQDIYRSAQTASGFYVAVFICSHLTAVFILARAMLGIDTDWAFASGGPDGMLYSAFGVRLFPYYLWSVFLVIMHVGLGARMVLLDHGVRAAIGHRIVMTAIALGIVLALAIGLALAPNVPHRHF